MSTISIQCVHCKKRYNAPATMAGKKVKCKHCGKVFAIPANDSEPVEAGDSDNVGSTPAPTPFSKAAANAAAKAAGAGEGKGQVGGKLGQASAGYATKMARSENAIDVGLAEESAPIIMLRPSIPHEFAGAAVIDQIAPLFMALAGLGWLSWAALKPNSTGVEWVAVARLAAYLSLCILVAFPLGFMAVRMAAGKCRLMLPPKSGLRAFGTFALAFAIALVFWLSGESVGMLVFGTIMGLVLVCAAVWFLFRVQTQEIQTILGSAGGAYIASIIVSYLVLFGINAIFASSARSSGSNQLASSPMGPTFDWDIPIGEKAKPNKPRNTVALVPDTQPDTVPSTGPTTLPDTGATKPSPPIPTTTTVVAPNPDPNPATRTSPIPPVTPTTTVAVKPATAPAVTNLNEPTSPLVAKISQVADLTDFNQVFFPPGVGNVAVASKRNETDETVEFFAGNPLAMKGETKFDIEKGLKQKCCLSANGETLGRLTLFPKLGVVLWNTLANKELKTVPLNAAHGTPEFLGFGFNDTLVILWDTGAFVDVEVINTKGIVPQTVTALRLKTFDRSPSSPTISPDGRQMAVATFFDKRGGIDLWDLTVSRKAEMRTCFVDLGTWVQPTAITYAPTGANLAAYFEQGSKGVLCHFRTGDAGKVHEFPYRTLPYPAGVADMFTGRTLDYLDPNTWILLGHTVLDIETGKVLGDLEIENVRAQRVVDKETLLVQTQSAEGKNQLLQVKLKGDVLAAKRAEARGLKAPTHTP
jgi:hypothetical protein